MRKRAFVIENYSLLWLDKQLLSEGISEGWIAYFQKGMRNANGSPRRPKYLLKSSEPPYFIKNMNTLDNYFK